MLVIAVCFGVNRHFSRRITVHFQRAWISPGSHHQPWCRKAAVARYLSNTRVVFADWYVDCLFLEITPVSGDQSDCSVWIAAACPVFLTRCAIHLDLYVVCCIQTGVWKITGSHCGCIQKGVWIITGSHCDLQMASGGLHHRCKASGDPHESQLAVILPWEIQGPRGWTPLNGTSESSLIHFGFSFFFLPKRQ